ncbi:MAG: ribosomal protein S18-alanine N-acetyltransferase [Halanaerobiaceae bacterium]
MEIKFKKMGLEHLGEVLRIEHQSFSDPWSRRSFVREVKENPYANYFVAIHNNEIVGYIGGWMVTDELHITNLAVDRESRKKGIAEFLIDNLLLYSKEYDINRATLEVRVSNIPAINLYRKKGFVSLGHRKSYYTNNNEDALIMWKEFDSGKDENRQ